MRDASPWVYVVSGALAMGYALAALFFAKFRRRTGSRLFSWFAAAFALLVAQRVLLLVHEPVSEDAMPWGYLVRLLAFVLILVGIIEQNRAAGRTTVPQIFINGRGIGGSDELAALEASGELDKMLERAANHQESEMDNLIATMLSVLEPLLIVIMGLVVLAIVMAILLPIFQINQLAR